LQPKWKDCGSDFGRVDMEIDLLIEGETAVLEIRV
jgi:hypothetical protein